MNHPNLQYGSVCSGIEAVSLVWQPLDCRPAWFSEIGPFPNAVLAHHYPDVPNLGDMTGIADQVFARTVTSPDILVGGTSCQAFSVAGARKGLADPRGALTLKYKELANVIDETRQQLYQPSVTVCFGGGNRQGPIDTATCLTARGHKCDFEVETFAAQSVTGLRTHALNTANGGKGSSENGTGRGVPIVTYKATLPGMPVAFSQNSRNEVRLEGGDGQIAGALSIGGGKPGQGFPAITYASARYAAPEIQDGQQAPILGFTAKDYGADILENLAPNPPRGGTPEVIRMPASCRRSPSKRCKRPSTTIYPAS